MRILTNAFTLSPYSGVDVNVFQMSNALAARGHELDVIAERGGELDDEYRAFCRTVGVRRILHEPLSPYYLAHPIGLARWGARLGQAAWASRANRPDVVYANDDAALAWALATSRASGSRVVCHLHDSARGPIGRQRALAARFVDGFLVGSQWARADWIGNGLPAERIQVLPCGVNPVQYPPASAADRLAARKQLGLPPEAFVVLFLGQVAPYKGVHVLLDAWKRMGLDPGQARVVVMGAVPSAPYGREIWATAPPGSMFFPMRRDVVTPLHAADVLAMPSVGDETFGRVVIEAMATGCPVVASNAGGVPETLTGRFSSLVVERGDAHALADRLSAMIGWQEREPDLASACTDHVRQNFSLDDVAQRLERILLAVQRR